MKTLIVNQKYLVLILTIVLVTFGTQGSSAQTITASTPQPLTEATLHGSVITLTLSGGTYERWIRGGTVSVSGIDGVTFDSWDVERVSDTELTVELTFSGDFDSNATLTFNVEAGAIVEYNGPALTAEVPVTAMQESLVASTESPLTEATLHGSVVTLTLSGRNYARSTFDVRDAVTISGIDGVSAGTFGIDRVSNTEVTVELTFSGDFDSNATLTFNVEAGAIVGYNGPALTAEVPVTAMQESLVASTESPLTEATLHGSIATLTLSGRSFASSFFDIRDALTVSGIEGVSFDSFFDVDRVSDTQVTIELSFLDDIDEDGTLTVTVGADAVAGYDQAFTAQLSVTAVQESLDASSEFPLTEATLNGGVVKLTLIGRSYERFIFDVRDAVSVSGIEGVKIERLFVSSHDNTELIVELDYDGTDFDEDGTITFTVGADAIAGYSQVLIAQISITAVKQSEATIRLLPNPIVSPPLDEQLTINLNITGGKNVAGYQAIVRFDASTLRYVDSAEGDYLPADTFFVPNSIVIEEDYRFPYVPLAATTLDRVGNGDGTLATLTFEVIDVKTSTLTLSHVYLVDQDGERWEVNIEGTKVAEPPHDIFGDINRDGVVNIRDLILVSLRFGQRGQNSADVNADGIVDIVDLVLAAGAIENGAAAPSVYPQALEMLTSAEVRQWLSQAQHLHLTDATAQRGILFLEQLLAALTPKETALLPNFPNPFNPETWIPYHLSKDADVALRIYAVNGTLVRTLTLGYQPAGIYQSRSRAAYWDGKNEFGEPVASGLYFYTLTAGDFSATRKMLIRK